MNDPFFYYTITSFWFIITLALVLDYILYK